MSELFWINGAFKPLSPALMPDDAGVVNGLGVFDSLLSVDGALQHADEHFARLKRDARVVMNVSIDTQDLLDVAQKLIAQNARSGHARIRTVVTAGKTSHPLAQIEHVNIFMTAEACVPPPTTPLTCVVVTDFPRMAGCALEHCKRVDYTRAYAARRVAETRGANDAILTNTNGHAVCGTTSNLFIVEKGVWITPPLSDGCLDGITRRHVITDKAAREEHIPLPRLYAADSVFVTNSFFGVRPVHLIQI